MTSVKKTRLALGLTQPELAAYFSITTSLLAMIETAQRHLPATALTKLVSLERHIAVNDLTYVTTEAQKQSLQAKKMLATQAMKYSRLALITTNKLDAMRSRHSKCMKMLQVANGLLAELPPGEAGKKDRLLLEIFQAEAIKKMRTCGPGHQAVLQLQAEGFSYQAERAQEMMEPAGGLT